MTKRIHRSGYHIEWNKKYGNKTSSEDRIENQANETDQDDLVPELTYADEVVDSTVEYSEENETINAAVQEEGLSVSNTRDSQIEDDHSIGQDNLPIAQVDRGPPIEESVNHDSDTVVKEKSDSIGKILGDIGKIMLFLGILLIIGSLFLYFGFNGLANLFGTLVFSGNGFLVGVLGFLLFLIILIAVFLFAFIVEAIGGYLVGLLVGSILIVLGVSLMLISNKLKN
ncbi:MAG: hypothetical protein GQ574_03455 [Crocinitomix sp.]|nr:hypothetical protein [Crocinitomix sp.]